MFCIYILFRMNLTQKNASQFNCEICSFLCSKESEWKRHIITRKHQYRTKQNVVEQNEPPNNSYQYMCHCGKTYSARNSLWYHKQKCSIVLGIDNPKCNVNTTTQENNDQSSGFHIDKELLIKMLLKNQDVMENVILKNQEVMEKMMEMMPQIGNSQVHTNSHNTTNNQFNIQMFLNEHCKNAMNLTDFIESLPITAATFDNTIEYGLTKTVTNMITNGLSKLDILERPIHCTDATRKTLYVKEANVWEKDTELKKVLSGITNLIVKKRDLICKWKEANRGWDTIESKQIRFTELVCNLMTDVERDEKETGKIIRSISKTVYLDNEDKKKYIC
jgi:hypothetical protein